MRKKSKMIIAAIVTTGVLLLFAVVVIINYNNKPEHKLIRQIKKFEDIISSGNLEGLTLTIYHTSPYDKREIHWNLEQLIYYVEKYKSSSSKPDVFRDEIGHRILRDYMDVLGQLTTDKIELAEEPAGIKGVMDARIYYVFKLNDVPILEVLMWSCSERSFPVWEGKWLNIYVNGVEVEGNKAFYDVIMPFLPKKCAEDLENYITNTLPDNYREPVWESDEGNVDPNPADIGYNDHLS